MKNYLKHLTTLYKVEFYKPFFSNSLRVTFETLNDLKEFESSEHLEVLEAYYSNVTLYYIQEVIAI